VRYKLVIKKFETFDLKGSIIYIGICSFIVTVVGLAINYNYIAHSNGIPFGGLVAMGLAIGVTVFGTFMRFLDRKRFKDTILGYTDNGTGVICKGYVGKMNAPQTLEGFILDIYNSEVEVMNFWAGKLPIGILTLINYFDGGMLGFTKTHIDLLLHSPTGPLLVPPGFIRWAVGDTSGNWSCAEFPDGGDWQTVLRIIKHENGHKCLNAANVDPNTHHQVMNTQGFKY
jgi:hypothetical protein